MRDQWFAISGFMDRPAELYLDEKASNRMAIMVAQLTLLFQRIHALHADQGFLTILLEYGGRQSASEILQPSSPVLNAFCRYGYLVRNP